MGDQLFRGLTGLLLFAFLIVWGSNLFRVRGSGSLFYSERETLLLAAVIRGLSVASVAGVCAYLIDPGAMAWSNLSLPGWLRLSGIVIGGAGVGLLQWVFATLGNNFSMSLVIKQDHSLVTSGPYRWARHPMYTGFTMVFTGLSLLSASWFVAGTAAIAFGAAMIIRTPQEERMLLEKFGDQYRAYMRRTGRFLPGRDG
jgi:protein-S-isoprenylcysteine O-methyltransferase Ste14